MDVNYSGLNLNDPVAAMNLRDYASNVSTELTGRAETEAIEQGLPYEADPEEDEAVELRDSIEWQYAKAFMVELASTWGVGITITVNSHD